MLKGVGLTYLWRETLVLVAMTLVLLVASARSFKVRLAMTFLRAARSSGTLVLARAEVLHVVRDKATLVQIIVMPLIQLLLLSNVGDVRDQASPAYVVDYDHTSTSRGVVERLGASGSLRRRRAVGVAGLGERRDAARTRDARRDDPARLRELARARRHGADHLDVNAEKGSAAGIVQSYAMQILVATTRVS